MNRLIYLLVALFMWSCEYGEFDSSYSELAEDQVNVERENYNDFEENPFVKVVDTPISTFSIDADGGSYANCRRFIESGQSPPIAAVRVEEFINYFPLDYKNSTDEHPISLNGEISRCPWNAEHKLVRIGIKGNSFAENELPPSNIVLLIDVSGSMSSSNKLGLLKKSFKLMVDQFSSRDRVAIVTYAGEDKVVLRSTAGNEQENIKKAIDRLDAGGGTAGAKGIITAYEIATENFIKGGNNRIILATDGDFNIGPSSQDELVELIEEKRETGVFLTVVGAGTGNYNEGGMEQLANNGNGTYEYIDDIEQGRKVFVDEYGKFFARAKDVKVQLEFNREVVAEYRLIGYENRRLETEDFEDDTKDAGEIGAGQNVTALYEIIPVDPIGFKNANAFTVDFRYKQPDGDVSIPLELTIPDANTPFSQASENQRFVAATAAFAMLLRTSKYSGDASYDTTLEWISKCLKYDPYNYRKDMMDVVLEAKAL